MVLLPTQTDTFLLVLLPPRLTPRPERCQGLTATPAQLEQRDGSPGRPRCWDTGDVVGDQSTERQGMFCEGDQSIGIRGCTGRPISTARVRFPVTQTAPRCWCGASRSSAVPKPGLETSFLGQKCFTSGLGWIKHPQACSTTSILNSPAAGLMFGTRTAGRARGRRREWGQSPDHLWGCPAMRSDSSRPAARDRARSRQCPPATRVNPVARTPAGEEIQHLSD